LCDLNCHIYNYEGGGPAVLSGVTCRTLEGDYGILDLSQLEDKIRSTQDNHLVRTRLVCLENTHNRGGGKIYPLEKIENIGRWAKQHNLVMHLDGARLWNAIVETGISARDWCRQFDSVSVCFSKGLGAPIGSALAGSRAFIHKGRRIRKLFGGGMRQAGMAAAAAIYALDHHIDRLAEDHKNARMLARAIADTPGLRLRHPDVDTNLIWFDVDRDVATAPEVAARIKEQGILVHCAGPQTLRACTHLDVSAAQAEKAAHVISKAVKRGVAVNS
jgi:threonine aldolase